MTESTARCTARNRVGMLSGRGGFMVVIGVLLLYAGVRQQLHLHVVEGASMEPRFRDGDRVVTFNIPIRRIVRRGSVVAFIPPPWLVKRPALLMKRVVAVSGDREPGWLPAKFRSGSTRVAHGYVLVRGDNSVSLDSRSIGPVPLSAIKRVIIFRLGAGRDAI